MQTQTFTWTNPNVKNRTFVGSVEIKNGKAVISIQSRNGMSGAEKYQMKDFAVKNIVPGLLELVVKQKESSNGLLAELFDKTQDLKEAYINKTKEYAKRQFEYAEKQNSYTLEQWCKHYGLNVTTRKNYDGKIIETPVVATKEDGIKWDELSSRKYAVKGMIEKGFIEFEAKEIEKSTIHYTNSIEKLCFKLNGLGVVDGTEFTVTNPRLGVNMEVYINFPGGLVHAYTIIAEGPIQRPHYRYLIKVKK